MSPSTAVRMEEANDTEITLGTGKMLALFFGLVHVTLLEGQPFAPAPVARVIDSVVLPGATTGSCNASPA